jgi:hypothetical protein
MFVKVVLYLRGPIVVFNARQVYNIQIRALQYMILIVWQADSYFLHGVKLSLIEVIVCRILSHTLNQLLNSWESLNEISLIAAITLVEFQRRRRF